MADLIKDKVIHAVSKKSSESQSPRETMSFGPELKYVGALPTSNNYNFEEEILLGEDKIIEKEYDFYDTEESKTCYHEIRYYTNYPSIYGYYYLEYFEYDTRVNPDYDYRVDGTKLIIDLDYSNYGGSEFRNLAKKFKLYYRKAKSDASGGYEDILIAVKKLIISYKTISSGVTVCEENYSWS